MFEALCHWRVRKADHNKHNISAKEWREVKKLRVEDNMLDIFYFTSSNVIKTTEIYGPSLLLGGLL